MVEKYFLLFLLYCSIGYQLMFPLFFVFSQYLCEKSFAFAQIWTVAVFWCYLSHKEKNRVVFQEIPIVVGNYLVFLLFKCDFFCLCLQQYLSKGKSNWTGNLTTDGNWLVKFSYARKKQNFKFDCSFGLFTFLHCFLLFAISLRAKKKGFLTINFLFHFWKDACLKVLKNAPSEIVNNN